MSKHDLKQFSDFRIAKQDLTEMAFNKNHTEMFKQVTWLGVRTFQGKNKT